MYAIEYCLENSIRAAIYIQDINPSFKKYLQFCYSCNVVLSSISNVSVTNLVHTFTVEEKADINFKNFFYINPDSISTKYQSETEQCLSLVRALYPTNYTSNILKRLQADESDRVKKLCVSMKTVIYPGCSSFAPVRRWPFYDQLVSTLGEENVVIIGGLDELNDAYAFRYKKLVAKLSPYRLTNRKIFWNFCKIFFLLEPYAHNAKFAHLPCSYFDIFNWGELVAIFRNCKKIIGNDGGLMHLAAASGAKGLAIFGPTSEAKSKPYNHEIEVLSRRYSCQPCHFQVRKIYLGEYFISCPYSIKCLESISVNEILRKLS
ncbi:MAG: glycosyltransferase family 9 protein [Candidatus Electrothrix communis]|nr:MAG: glycosyltransferase family 9 protein [Candidatus Electrothrix communis]